MKRAIIISAGIIGVLAGLGFVFPAIALMHNSGGLPNASVGLLLLGVGMTLGGITAAFRALMGRRVG
jgi:hypothetical protein